MGWSLLPPATIPGATMGADGAAVSFRTAATRVLGPFLVSRVFILLVGYLSTLVFLKGPAWEEPASLLDLFFYWDANWYERIVTEGYQYVPGKASSVAFFPLFPLLVKALAPLVGVKLAGYLIANAAFFVGTVYFYRLVALDFAEREIAERSLWYLLVSPVSFFFSIFYTEGLFFGLVVATFWQARRRAWAAASLLAALAALTRSLGVVLLVPLLCEYLGLTYGRLRPDRTRIGKEALWFLAVPAGLGLYLAYLQLAFGDAFAFSRASALWHRKFVLLPKTLLNLKIYEPFYLCLFLGTVVAALVLLWVVVRCRLRFSYVVYFALFLFLYLSSNILDSIQRYVAVLFPLYIGLALLAHGRRDWDRAIAAGSVALLVMATILFTNGYWMV